MPIGTGARSEMSTSLVVFSVPGSIFVRRPLVETTHTPVLPTATATGRSETRFLLRLLAASSRSRESLPPLVTQTDPSPTAIERGRGWNAHGFPLTLGGTGSGFPIGT